MALVTDPVCEMEFDERLAAAWSIYGDHTYYFCHPVCKKIFEVDPSRFIETVQSEPGTAGPGMVRETERASLKPDSKRRIKRQKTGA